MSLAILAFHAFLGSRFTAIFWWVVLYHAVYLAQKNYFREIFNWFVTPNQWQGSDFFLSPNMDPAELKKYTERLHTDQHIKYAYCIACLPCLVEGEPYLVCGSVRALDMPLKILVETKGLVAGRAGERRNLLETLQGCRSVF